MTLIITLTASNLSLILMWYNSYTQTDIQKMINSHWYQTNLRLTCTDLYNEKLIVLSINCSVAVLRNYNCIRWCHCYNPQLKHITILLLIINNENNIYHNDN